MIGDKNKIPNNDNNKKVIIKAWIRCIDKNPNNDNNKKVIIKTNIGGLNKNPKMFKIKLNNK